MEGLALHPHEALGLSGLRFVCMARAVFPLPLFVSFSWREQWEGTFTAQGDEGFILYALHFYIINWLPVPFHPSQRSTPRWG